MPRFKPEVREARVYPEMWYALGFLDGILALLWGKEGVVTSMNDSVHAPNSYHYKDRALDYRTRDLTPEQVQVLFAAARQFLDPEGFDTVNEGDHIHVEFDPKDGETFVKRIS